MRLGAGAGTGLGTQGAVLGMETPVDPRGHPTGVPRGHGAGWVSERQKDAGLG